MKAKAAFIIARKNSSSHKINKKQLYKYLKLQAKKWGNTTWAPTFLQQTSSTSIFFATLHHQTFNTNHSNLHYNIKAPRADD